VPAGLIIDGIEVVAEKKATDASGNYTLAAELSYDGGASYTASGESVSFTNTTDNTYTFGGSTDAWGRTWNPADFGDANFRVRLTGSVPGNSASKYVYVDQVTVRVYYTEANDKVPVIDLNGSSARIEVDQSHNVIATGFSAPSVYVDGAAGAAVGTGSWYYVTVTDSEGVSASALKLGHAGARYFDGILDEVRIYDRVLTADEVSQLANGSACP